MKAVESSLIKFLHGTKQLIIPIYQRTYSWGIEQCKQLWDDICRVTQDVTIPAHFIGSVVYVEKGLYVVSHVPQLLVIDGQQRLTTLTLLLAALGRAMEERSIEGEISWRKIKNYYLVNSEEGSDKRYKLVLSRSDKSTLTHIIENGLADLPADAAVRLVENYRFFAEQIHKSGLDLEALYFGINKLLIVDISLDRQCDNPQLIFESLNSTGLDLTQADLIRNFILMGLEPDQQERLYNKYWFPMERDFDPTCAPQLFDRFMRDFLTVKLGRIPNIDQVYSEFKEYYISQGKRDVEEVVHEVYKFSRHFVRIALLIEQDKEIRTVLSDIRDLNIDVAYPLFLEAFNDHEAGLLSREDLLSILRTVESYVFRRTICGIPTNSLNKTFATLCREIDKDNYRESVEVALAVKDSYRRFPRDEEFKACFITKDVYNTRIRSYLLRKLENHERKESVSVDEYTIEHIMPQNENLSAEWQLELGTNWHEVHEKYLHTIGNLTLTGYNSELSDHPFQEKRTKDGGFADSPIRLNKMLANLDHWNEQEIVKRATGLADKAVSIWRYPQCSLPEKVTIESARGAILSVFGTEEELAAARSYFQMLGNLAGDSGHILSITYRDGNTITANLGIWLVLRFRRTTTGIQVAFVADLTEAPNLADFAEDSMPFAAQWAGDRDIRLLYFPWKPKQALPEGLLDAWKNAIGRGCQVFHHWRSTPTTRFHQPLLADELIGKTAAPSYEENLQGELKMVFDELRERILRLDPSIREEYLKVYIAYKTSTNFVDIVPQKNRLRLSLNMKFGEIIDPKGVCRDVSTVDHHGNGDVELLVSRQEDIDYAMTLIRQAFDKYFDEVA